MVGFLIGIIFGFIIGFYTAAKLEARIITDDDYEDYNPFKEDL